MAARTYCCRLCGADSRAGGEKLFTCAGCNHAWYCSKEHQKQDWKEHKKACKAQQAAARARVSTTAGEGLAQTIKDEYATTPFRRALLHVPSNFELVGSLALAGTVNFSDFCERSDQIGAGVLKTFFHNANRSKGQQYRHVCTVKLGPTDGATTFDLAAYPRNTYTVSPGGVVTVDLGDDAEEGWGMLTNYADRLNTTGLHRDLAALGERIIARVTPYYNCGVAAHFAYPEGGMAGDAAGQVSAIGLQGLADHLEYIAQAHSMAGPSISNSNIAPLFVKMAQNLDLRCVLVPAPWVGGGQNTSRIQNKRSLRHIGFAGRALRNVHSYDAAAAMLNKGLECIAPFRKFGSTRAPRWLKANVATIIKHLRTDLNTALAITAEKQGQVGHALALRRSEYAKAEDSADPSHLARAAMSLASCMLKSTSGSFDVLGARHEADPLLAKALTGAREYYTQACADAGEACLNFSAQPGAGEWDSAAPAVRDSADAGNCLATSLIHSATMASIIACTEEDRGIMLREALGICRAYRDAVNAIETLAHLSNRASNLQVESILHAKYDGGNAVDADAKSLAEAKAWRDELVLLMKRQGKDPGEDCCVCLEPIEGDSDGDAQPAWHGKRVRLHGLKTNALNDRLGTVLNTPAANHGRVPVCLDPVVGGDESKTVSLKTGNLAVLHGDGGAQGGSSSVPASVFVFSCYHQVHGACVKELAGSMQHSPGNAAAFQLPPCPLCRAHGPFSRVE